MNHPLLSICMPTRNRAHWLKATLPLWVEEVKEFGEECELIVSDNASTDDTQLFVKSLQESSFIKYSRNPQDIGSNPNFFKAVSELATGTFAWVVGDDDAPTKGSVARVLGAIKENPNLRFFYANYVVWPAEGAPSGLVDTCRWVKEGNPNSLDVVDRRLNTLREVVGSDSSCFCSIYSLIMKRENLMEAFCPSLSAPHFSTAESVISHALYVVKNYMDDPAYYLGRPCIIASPDCHWPEFAPILHLHIVQELYDAVEQHGISRDKVDAMRKEKLPVSARLLHDIVFVRNTPYRKHFSLGHYWSKHWRYREFYPMLLKTGFLTFYYFSPRPVGRFMKRFWRTLRPVVHSDTISDPLKDR